MNAEDVIYLCTQALETAVTLSLPAILAALVVGLLVSIGQAATQIQEQSLPVVVKIIAVFLVLGLTAPWMAETAATFVGDLLDRIAGIGP